MEQKRDDYDFHSTSTERGLYPFGKDGKFFFHYNDINGEPLVFSEVYQSEQGRDKGMQSFLKNIILPTQIVFNTMEDNRCYFLVRAKNFQEIAQSKIFKNEQAMKETLANIVTTLSSPIAEESLEHYHPSGSYMEQEEKIVDLTLQLENKQKKISYLNEIISDLKLKIEGYSTMQTSSKESALLIANLEKEVITEKSNHERILDQARKKYAQLEIAYFSEKKARDKDIEQLSKYEKQIGKLKEQIQPSEDALQQLEASLQKAQNQVAQQELLLQENKIQFDRNQIEWQSTMSRKQETIQLLETEVTRLQGLMPIENDLTPQDITILEKEKNALQINLKELGQALNTAVKEKKQQEEQLNEFRERIRSLTKKLSEKEDAYSQEPTLPQVNDTNKHTFLLEILPNEFSPSSFCLLQLGTNRKKVFKDFQQEELWSFLVDKNNLNQAQTQPIKIEAKQEVEKEVPIPIEQEPIPPVIKDSTPITREKTNAFAPVYKNQGLLLLEEPIITIDLKEWELKGEWTFQIEMNIKGCCDKETYSSRGTVPINRQLAIPIDPNLLDGLTKVYLQILLRTKDQTPIAIFREVWINY